MMKNFVVYFCLFTSSYSLATPQDINIRAEGNLASEAKQVLLDLLQRYDLRRFIYTKDIVIESNVIPHSHPVLTLQAEEKDRPDELLGTFIHEQMHWYWIESSPGRDVGPRVEFKLKYPNAPTKPPEGSGNESSTLQHLGVCWLEYLGLIQTVGAERARKVISAKRYYTWIYKTVLTDSDYIASVMKKYNMHNPTGLQ